MNKEQRNKLVWLLGNYIASWGADDVKMVEQAQKEIEKWAKQLTAPTQELLTKEKFLEIVNDSDNYTVCGSEYSLKYDWDKIFEKLSKLSKMAEAGK